MASAVGDLSRLLQKKTSTRIEAKGIVVAPQPEAAAVGAEILRAGGNAVDAALATGFAQGIVDPLMGGIGGFGCLLIHSADTQKTTAIGFHGRAGSQARPDIFSDQVIGQIHGHAERYEVKDAANQIGYRSVVVPGTPAGFGAAHKQFGRLPWKTILEPAIALARDGVFLAGEVYDRWTEICEPGHRTGIERINATAACQKVFAPEGNMLLPGALLRQPDYATTLEWLGRAGTDDFYRGDIGRTIAADFEKNGGLFTAKDLATYEPDIGPPVIGRYRGLEIRSVPLPASGVQLVEMLNVLEHFDLASLRRADRALYVHIVARAMLASFSDRVCYLGDPRFVEVPIERLCSAEHAAELATKVCGDEPIEVSGLGYRESQHTTQVCVLDAEGNAVTLTHTLGSASGVVTPGLGFVFNNCMYQYHPFPGHPNSIAPGKSRMTGITGTIILKEGRPWLATGALGGTRMPSAVLHTVLNIIDHGHSPVEAVEGARFHAESAWLEMESRLYFDLGKSLASLGWRLRPSPRGYDRAFGLAFAVLRDSEGTFHGGSDPRGGGGISVA